METVLSLKNLCQYLISEKEKDLVSEEEVADKILSLLSSQKERNEREEELFSHCLTMNVSRNSSHLHPYGFDEKMASKIKEKEWEEFKRIVHLLHEQTRASH